jgi:hypothetical protein
LRLRPRPPRTPSRPLNSGPRMYAMIPSVWSGAVDRKEIGGGRKRRGERIVVGGIGSGLCVRGCLCGGSGRQWRASLCLLRVREEEHSLLQARKVSAVICKICSRTVSMWASHPPGTCGTGSRKRMLQHRAGNDIHTHFVAPLVSVGDAGA